MSPTEDGLTVGFQRVADAKLGKNRVHLDLVVDDLDQATAEIENLGGRWLEPGNTRELEVSGGGAWPTPRATNSTSTSSPARREDIRTRPGWTAGQAQATRPPRDLRTADYSSGQPHLADLRQRHRRKTSLVAKLDKALVRH